MSGVEDKLRDLLAAMEKERSEKEKAEQKEASSKISEKDARAIVCFSFSHSPPLIIIFITLFVFSHIL